MTLSNIIAVVLVTLTTSIITAAIGYDKGAKDRQALVVQDCRTKGIYLDRDLFIVCQAGKPVVVPKPDSL